MTVKECKKPTTQHNIFKNMALTWTVAILTCSQTHPSTDAYNILLSIHTKQDT